MVTSGIDEHKSGCTIRMSSIVDVGASLSLSQCSEAKVRIGHFKRV